MFNTVTALTHTWLMFNTLTTLTYMVDVQYCHSIDTHGWSSILTKSFRNITATSYSNSFCGTGFVLQHWTQSLPRGHWVSKILFYLLNDWIMIMPPPPEKGSGGIWQSLFSFIPPVCINLHQQFEDVKSWTIKFNLRCSAYNQGLGGW